MVRFRNNTTPLYLRFDCLKSIMVISLILLLLSPQLIQVLHHHEQGECHEKQEKHIHDTHENCAICNFHLAQFTDTPNYFPTLYKNRYSAKDIAYNPPALCDPFNQCITLRGPPGFTY